MTLLGVRSIPLSQETINAWNSVGVRFIRRGRRIEDIDRLIARFRHNGILNLGNLEYNFENREYDIWNTPHSVRSVSAPSALKQTLGEFTPDSDSHVPHWHKRAGMHGMGKVFHDRLIGECAVVGGIVQKHIEGIEYRVITVGNTVVQAHRKEVVDENRIPRVFTWHWTGVDGIRTNGIVPHIKSAIEGVPGWDHCVFGWDIIVEQGTNRVYTIEINTSPGVNTHTAQRIMNRIERISNE